MKANNDHTFTVCAYKESPHLEACINSLLNQTVKTNILISTSTPNEFIKNIAEKYNIPLYFTNEPSDIQNDWNRAYEKATTKLVTVAHQDDVYDERYVEELLKAYRKDSNATLYFTDYKPIKDGIVGKRDINCKLRKLARTPLKAKFLSKKRFIKVATLAFGNSINCPSVTYNKELIGNNVFTSDLKFALDWDTFLKFARKKGRFYYIDQVLIYYRVYNGATTKKFIVDNTRQIEDTIMFNKIWPKFITKIIMKFYVKAYDTYG